ncbi:hypothetical protein K435DRAFT_860392 [Dendrothele bispora CBS 962.96]|uniref:Uncharacterized protein n=1 Tax=Dendrothele bispora (strain CBS 962.96) TaxID=1314807 RepID=A0A4S8LZB4_DENBC|nr:hypothetical protein K435DRAFT_860392 [Dendrothele bispora CBS 962.96]
MAPKEKKKPGRKPWYADEDDSRLGFLRKHVDEHDQCEKAKGDAITKFYNTVTIKFLKEFEAPKQSDDNAITAGSMAAAQTTSTAIDESGVQPSGQQEASSSSSHDQDESSQPNEEGNAPGTPAEDGVQTNLMPNQDGSDGNDGQVSQPAQTGPSSTAQVQSGSDHISFANAARELGWVGLSGMEFEGKRKHFVQMREKISEWFRQNRRSINASTENSLIKKVFENSKQERKPQRTGVVQVFMDLHFDSYVKSEAAAAVKEAEELYRAWIEGGSEGDEVKKPVPIAIRTQVAKRIFEAQSEEFKAQIQQLADEKYEEALKKWEEKKTGGGAGEKVKTPQDYVKSLQSWGPEVATFTRTVSEDTGMVAIFALVGPNGQKGGQIDTFWTHAGTSTSGLLWPQADPAGYEATKQSLMKFGKRVYNAQARAARAVVNAPVLPLSGFGDASQAEDDHHTTSTTPQRQPPGPGRNSAGAKAVPSRKKRANPTSQPSANPNSSPRPERADRTSQRASQQRDKSAVPTPAPAVPGSGLDSQANSGSDVDGNTTPAPGVSNSPLVPSETTTTPITQSVPSPTEDPAPQPDSTELDSTQLDSTQPEPSISRSPADQEDSMQVDPKPTPSKLTIWTHPDRNRFWKEMGDFVDEWKEFVEAWGEWPWRETLETLLETFIEYEGYFHYTEDNGRLESKKELKLVKKWEKLGRKAFLIIAEPLETAKLILTDFRKWWEDILPDRENDEEDWAPLDSVSGRNGMWKVICALTWVLFFVLGEELVDLTDEQTSYLAGVDGPR